MSSLSLFLFAALAIFSCTVESGKKPPSPPPSPTPPKPIYPTCGMFLSFTLTKGNFSKSSVRGNAICNKFAALVNAHYTAPFNWTCNFIGSAGGKSDGVVNMLTIQAFPQLQQSLGISRFITLLNRNVDAQAIMQSLGGSCGDSLTLSTSCPNVNPVTIKRCKSPAPSPSVSVCNLTVSLNRAEGGLTTAQCGNFGNVINQLYGTQFLFACSGLQFSNTELSVTAANNYNAGPIIGKLLAATKTNTDAPKRLLSTYGLACGVDSVVFTSGPPYASCAGTATVNIPC